MGRSKNYDREERLIDRLKAENAQLKRENSKIRKQIDRLNINHDRYRTLRELIHKQHAEARAVKKSKKDWTCFVCGKGTMRLEPFPRRDGTFYWRKCDYSGCKNVTKLKKYTSDVEDS